MNVRREQGELIAQTKGSIKILDDRNYVVNSQSGNGFYNVQLTESGFVCSCTDRLYRGVKCKHIHAIDAFREGLENEIHPVNSFSRPYYK